MVISERQFIFELPLSEKKALLWETVCQHPEYSPLYSEPYFIAHVLSLLGRKYKHHRRAFIRFCGALNVSHRRIQYLDQWFQTHWMFFAFLQSLPSFSLFQVKTERFLEEFEETALAVWYYRLILDDQVSTATTRFVSQQANNAPPRPPLEDGDPEPV